MPTLALTSAPCLWEPRRLRLWLFSIIGRRRMLRLAKHRPWPM